jgi:hypothetical protein
VSGREEDYIGSYDRREVLVLADSGYDDKKIENAIANKGWNFIIALGTTRSVKSEALSLTTPKSQQWCHIETFFRRHRRLKWNTIRLATNGNKRKRMDFRVRHTSGYLRYVGKVELVCSELRNRPDGRRKYLACNDLRATARGATPWWHGRWSNARVGLGPSGCGRRRSLGHPGSGRKVLVVVIILLVVSPGCGPHRGRPQQEGHDHADGHPHRPDAGPEPPAPPGGGCACDHLCFMRLHTSLLHKVD